jgi:DNA-binding response OmpR family regulator
MRMKVLLVDDEKRFVSVLAKRLRMRGFDANHAFSGEQALSMAAETTYDVVALDVKMPGMGGIQLKARLEELNPHAKCIFVTGHGSLEDYAVGSSQASAYLSKPVDIDELIAAIRECTQTLTHDQETGS